MKSKLTHFPKISQKYFAPKDPDSVERFLSLNEKFKKIICNILPSLVNSNGLKIIEFKCHLKYNSYLHFEPVTPASAHTVLAYLKFNRNFYNAKAIILDVKNDEMLGCDGQVERKIKCTEIVHPNNNSCVYSDVEGQLNRDRVGKNETLVPMI